MMQFSVITFLKCCILFSTKLITNMNLHKTTRASGKDNLHPLQD